MDLTWHKSEHGGFTAVWERGSAQIAKVPNSGAFGGRPSWRYEIFESGKLIDKGIAGGKAQAKRACSHLLGKHVDEQQGPVSSKGQ